MPFRKILLHRNHKIMQRIPLLYFFWILLFSTFLLEGCLPEPKSKEQPQRSSSAQVSTPSSGKAVFKQHCITCHGANGQMGLNGAKNLTESMLTKEERVLLVTKGKGVMPAFGAQLSEAQIKAVAAYSMEFNTDL